MLCIYVLCVGKTSFSLSCLQHLYSLVGFQVHFSDKSASEMKKKKRSELAQIKEKWEKKRKAAEQAIRRTTYRGLFFRETDSKGNRVVSACLTWSIPVVSIGVHFEGLVAREAGHGISQKNGRLKRFH